MWMLQSLSSGQLCAMGLMLLMGALFLRRSTLRRAAKREPLQLVRAQFAAVEASPAGRMNRQAVELHEFAREVEGRIMTRMTRLEELLIEAERESLRLERLLETARQRTATLMHAGPDIIAGNTGSGDVPDQVPRGDAGRPLLAPPIPNPFRRAG